jgi:hypothetical protein
MVLILALLTAMGAHRIALQSVAWTTMIWSYSATASFVEAVEKTFDGEMPCDLCTRVISSDDSGISELAPQPVPELKGLLQPVLSPLNRTAVAARYFSSSSTGTLLHYPPPLPPPRLA